MKTSVRILSALMMFMVPVVSFAEADRLMHIRDLKGALLPEEKEIGSYIYSLPDHGTLSRFETKVSCQDTRNKESLPNEFRLEINPQQKSMMKTGTWASLNANVSVHFSQAMVGDRIKYVVIRKTKEVDEKKIAVVQEGWMQPSQESGVLGKEVPWLKCSSSGISFKKQPLAKKFQFTEAMAIGMPSKARLVMDKKMSGKMLMSQDPAQAPLEILERNMSYPAAPAAADLTAQ